MDEQTLLIFRWVIISVLCQLIEVFGVVTNIINIICFVKQGFKESVNINLTELTRFSLDKNVGLAISDLVSLVTLMLGTIWLTPSFSTADLPFDIMGVYYLTAGIPHVAFTRISSWVTAIITLERSVCVISPLQVKLMFTQKRMSIILVCVYIILIWSVCPLYVANRLEKTIIPGRNMTILGLSFTADRETIEKFSFIINSCVVPFAAFVIIIICTILLVMSLQRRESWLKSVTQKTSGEVSTRNKRTIKMVVIISVLFISCFVPITIMTLVVVFEPEFYFGGKYMNLSIIFCAIGLLLESINSSANIFIYYHMSSKYRETFHIMLNTCSDVRKRIT